MLLPPHCWAVLRCAVGSHAPLLQADFQDKNAAGVAKALASAAGVSEDKVVLVAVLPKVMPSSGTSNNSGRRLQESQVRGSSPAVPAAADVVPRIQLICTPMWLHHW